jgi:hypothetical protein
MICVDIEIMQISLGSTNDALHYKCVIDFLQRIAVLRHALPREPRRFGDALGGANRLIGHQF